MSSVGSSRTGSMLAAATAVIVSFASLYVAWRQSRLIERQLAASVWPALELTTSNDSDGKAVITLGMRNGGIGPARIRAFDLSYHGTPLKTWSELLSACCGTKAPEDRNVTSAQIVGRIVPAGQRFDFLRLVRTNDDDALWQKLNEARFELAGHVCYCSALDDCWSLDINAMEPSSVASCAEAARHTQYNSY